VTAFWHLIRQSAERRLRAGFARLGLVAAALVLALTGAGFLLMAAQGALAHLIGTPAASAVIGAVLVALSMLMLRLSRHKPAQPAPSAPLPGPSPPPAIGAAFLAGFLLARRMSRRQRR
jgi:uncharacterized membrane protein YfcA